MTLKKDEYFSDDCIVEDSLYLSLKDLLKCPLCHKLIKNPYMCNKCQISYCKKCLEVDSNLRKCPNEKIEGQFTHSILNENMLSKLKYKCKNCLKEVIQSDIKAHLEENCEHIEERKEKSLAEIIKTKKQIIKLSKEQMINKKIDKSLTSKKIFY